MLGRDREHLVADVAIGHHIVAQQNKEVLARNSVGSRANGMAQALGLILIAEVDRHVASVGNGIGILGFSALAQEVLEGAIGLEVAQQLGLSRRGDDDDTVDFLGVKRLLDDVLDDGLIEDRQHLLRSALRAGQEAGAEARSGDDGLHE